MKDEALILIDLLESFDVGRNLQLQASAMIRRLVEELDKQKEKAKWFEESNKMFKETRDSLAMAVMLDQTSRDTTPQTKPLSDEEIKEVIRKRLLEIRHTRCAQKSGPFQCRR